jgi:hypothetical protein
MSWIWTHFCVRHIRRHAKTTPICRALVDDSGFESAVRSCTSPCSQKPTLTIASYPKLVRIGNLFRNGFVNPSFDIGPVQGTHPTNGSNYKVIAPSSTFEKMLHVI